MNLNDRFTSGEFLMISNPIGQPEKPNREAAVHCKRAFPMEKNFCWRPDQSSFHQQHLAGALDGAIELSLVMGRQTRVLAG